MARSDADPHATTRAFYALPLDEHVTGHRGEHREPT